jgi:hypothetical protein
MSEAGRVGRPEKAYYPSFAALSIDFRPDRSYLSYLFIHVASGPPP